MNRDKRFDDGSEMRVFFVVDSIEDNSELFETFEGAEEYQLTLKVEDKPRLRICMIRNAFREDDGGWNYEDLADTFEEVKTLEKCSICNDDLYGEVQVHHHNEKCKKCGYNIIATQQHNCSTGIKNKGR